MRNHVFIQARIGSTRLPRKVLMKIHNKTILALIVERLKKIEPLDKIILVTGPENKNKELIEEALHLDIDHFCGSEENLLDRYFNASRKFDSENIIRITADCPLIDFNLINNGLKIFSQGYDIVCLGRIPSFPHGMDFEIFSADALNKAWENIRSKFEDVEKFYNTFICPTDYIINSSDFKKYDMISNVDMSKIRLTLDYQEDFELISKIFDILYIKNQYFTLEDIIELLKKNPSLMSINKKYADIRFNSSMK